MFYRLVFWAAVLALFLPINAYNGDVSWENSRLPEQSVSLVIALYQDATDFCVNNPQTCRKLSHVFAETSEIVTAVAERLFDENDAAGQQTDEIMTGSVNRD